MVASSVLYKFVVVDRIFYNISYKLPAKIDTLVVGASHLQLGFDDRDYENVVNFSNSGMPYFFTYAKSRRLLESNPQVKKLVVSLAPIHVSPYGDSTLFADEGLSRENSFAYFPLLQGYEGIGKKRWSLDFALSYLKYQWGVPFNYMEDLKPFLLSLKRPTHFNSMFFSGAFAINDDNNLNVQSVRKKADFYFGQSIRYSKHSIQALEMLAAFTEKQNVQLYVINMPTHKMFRDLTPKEYTDKHQELMQALQAKHANVHYLDYYAQDLPDTLFYDGDHLNIDGAKEMQPVFKADIAL